MEKYIFRWIFCLHFFLVHGWQCPANEGIQNIFGRLGEKTFLRFQTNLTKADGVLIYSVTKFDNKNLLTASFYNNVLKNIISYLGSEFIGNATTGNFTVKTATLHSQDGGMYLLRYKADPLDYSIVICLMLYVIDKPEKARISQDNSIVEGRDSHLTCNSLSTTYPTNHTLRLSYNWKVNDVINPTGNNKYVYSSFRKQLTIKSVSKEDANTSFICSATVSENSITGLSSDESDQLIFQVIYGPDVDTTKLTPPNTQYTLNEGGILNNITCSGKCYPSCNFKWTKSGTQINNGAVLSLGSLSKTDAALYTCEVINSNTTTIDKVKKEVTVNVIFGPDAITTRLIPPQTSYILNEGSPIGSIRCSSDCYPACNYKWTKTGNSSFTLVNNANLSLGSLSQDEAGTYICTISNTRSKQEQTKNVSIYVIFGPDASTTSLIPPQTSYTLNEGSPISSIRCSSDCYPDCTYKWTKTGNSGFKPVNNANLLLGSLMRNKAGTYICTVSNPRSKQEHTINISIFVIYGPDSNSLKLDPSKTSYTENERTHLNDITCSTDCFPTCTYEWTKAGSVFIVSNVLSLGMLSKEKAATYTCTAYNPTTRQNISKSVTVHVRFGPTFCSLNIHSPIIITEGVSTQEMTCQAECYPECTYSWTNISSNSPVGTNEKFQMINTKRYEAGRYNCLCENKPLDKSKLSTLEIIVHYPPDVTVLHTTTNFTEGNNLTLTCDAIGVPSYYQYNNLTQVWNGFLIPNRNSEKFGTPKHSSLYIPSLQLQDSGNYTCYVNNGVNTADSTSSVYIKVKGIPKVFMDLHTFIGQTDKETEVSIQFYSFPEIQNVFFKRNDSQIISNDAAKRYIVSHDETVVKDNFYGKEVSFPGMKANLVIQKMRPEDFGSYTLMLKNDIGGITIEFEIKAESEPSMPSRFRYEEKAGRHVLSWLSGFNGGHRQTFIIQTSIYDHNNWLNSSTIYEEASVKNFRLYSVNISDLGPGNYEARIFAFNKNGLSDYVYLNGTIRVEEKLHEEESVPLGIIIGVVSSVLALGAVAVIAFFVIRRVRNKDDGSQSRLNSGHHTTNDDSDDEDEVNTVNPMYISADVVNFGTSSENVYAKPANKKQEDMYAMVDKKTKKTNNDLHAMPEKKDIKKGKKDKLKKATGGDVYENAPVNAVEIGKKTAYEENPYENPEISGSTKGPKRNKDGLIYADLAFNNQPKGQKKLVIHGLDDMTEYVEVDFTKKAEPLPDSDEETK